MNVRDETRHDIHKSAALRYALLCIVTCLISDVHFHITGPKSTFNSEITELKRGYDVVCIYHALKLTIAAMTLHITQV